MEVIKYSIISKEFAPELVFLITPEFRYTAYREDADKPISLFFLVYRYDKQISKDEYLYIFAGGRTN